MVTSVFVGRMSILRFEGRSIPLYIFLHDLSPKDQKCNAVYPVPSLNSISNLSATLFGKCDESQALIPGGHPKKLVCRVEASAEA